MQAVLEQWASKVGEDRQADNPETPGSTLSAHFASLYSRNEAYIKEVVDASRTILKHVVYDLWPDNYLKHAPVRLHFRIVSAAMFLLKVQFVVIADCTLLILVSLLLSEADSVKSNSPFGFSKTRSKLFERVSSTICT